MNLEVEEHRAAARQALQQAATARELAGSIQREEVNLRQRLAPVIQRHTDDVWSSRAANESRLRVRTIDLDVLGGVTDDLAQVRLALDRRVGELEAQARAEHRHADVLEAAAASAAVGSLGVGGFA